MSLNDNVRMDFRGRQARLLAALRSQGLDALLVSHLPNVRYLSGFTGSAGALIVQDAGGKAPKCSFFSDGRYTAQARQEVTGAAVHIAAKQALTAAVDSLRKLAGRRKLRIGCEADHLTVSQWSALRKPASAIRWRPVTGMVESLRMIKEPAELDRIQRAVDLASTVFDQIVGDIRPGVREDQIAAEIEYLSRRLGAEGMSFDTIVASGKRSALPHGKASGQPIPEKGFVVLDFGVVLGGYCSDMTRTVYVGRPDRRSERIYASVLAAQEAGIKAVNAGVLTSEVDYAARKTLEKSRLGVYFTHSTGHGVGIEIHEPPALRHLSKPGRRAGKVQSERLAAGMVVTVEPGVYIPGFGGVRIEDMVVVTETGCRVLTPTPKELIAL